MTVKDRILNIPQLAGTPGIRELAAIIEQELAGIKSAALLQQNAAATELANNLFPDPVGRAMPCFGLCALQSETFATVSTEHQYSAAIRDDGPPIIFTPVYDGRCLPLAVKYVCVAGQWWDAENKGIPEKKALGEGLEGFLFLALRVVGWEKVEDLNGLQLYFHGLPEEVLPYLHYISAVCNGEELSVEPALFSDEEYLNTHLCTREFVHIYRQRKRVAEETAKTGVIRLKATGSSSNFFTNTVPQIPDDTDSENLVWITFKLPECIPDEIFLNCRVFTNVFPVWNVQKTRLERLRQTSIVVPLLRDNGKDETTAFFGLERVWSRADQLYAPRDLRPSGARTYILECRDPRVIGSIDLAAHVDALLARLSKIGLEGLAEMSQNHADVLQPHHGDLKDFNEKWNKIRDKLIAYKRRDYYLRIYPESTDDVTYIDYLLTQPEAGQVLWPDFQNLTPLHESAVSAEMITAPKVTPGEMNMEERIAWLKAQLFSENV